MQPNPLRVHLRVLRDGELHPLCGRPGAWRMTRDPNLVTCKACAHMLRLPEVRR